MNSLLCGMSTRFARAWLYAQARDCLAPKDMPAQSRSHATQNVFVQNALRNREMLDLFYPTSRIAKKTLSALNAMCIMMGTPILRVRSYASPIATASTKIGASE